MKLGLFLTPGAARAAYQVGAVRALVEERGLRFDVVGASSVGALNGAFVATGQVEKLADLWSGWKTSDIMGVDWGALLRGAVLWAPNLMHNRPQKERVINPNVDEAKLLPELRFRFNLADLTGGGQQVLEWPGAPMALHEGVNAAVAVPAAIRPHETLGRQWADGLTVDGFPLEQLVLETGVERVFVVGVAPRGEIPERCNNAYVTLLRALEWNQYSETIGGLERAEDTNQDIRDWQAARRRAADAIESVVDDADLRRDLLSELNRLYEEAGYPTSRDVVEIVPILPEWPIEMLFTDYRPHRSRALLRQGRRDALRVLDNLDA